MHESVISIMPEAEAEPVTLCPQCQDGNHAFHAKRFPVRNAITHDITKYDCKCKCVFQKEFEKRKRQRAEHGHNYIVWSD
jgi:hypothetical protein